MNDQNQNRGGTATVAERESEPTKKASSERRPNDDQKTGDDDKRPEPAKKKGGGKPPKKVLIIAGIVFAVLVVGGILYWLHARNYESTDDAFTAGHVHEISSRVPGTIQAVLVHDNEVVRKDQTLATLDSREFELARERARAQLAQARAAIEQAQADVTQKEAATSQATAQLEKSMTDYQRVAGLYQQDMKAVAKAEVDAASAQLKTAKGAFEAAKASETAARAQQTTAQAGLQSAGAGLHDAELQLSYTTITAPVDGTVGKKAVESGRRIQPGQALMAVVEPRTWVIANFKETQLAQVKIGQAVEIEVDAIPDHEFNGHVDSFQPGTGATFALLPPDNATGNFTKIVQRVPVKIVFEPESVRGFENRIVPGLSVVPTIDLRSR